MLTGPVDSRYKFVDMTNVSVKVNETYTVSKFIHTFVVEFGFNIFYFTIGDYIRVMVQDYINPSC